MRINISDQSKHLSRFASDLSCARQFQDAEIYCADPFIGDPKITPESPQAKLSFRLTLFRGKVIRYRYVITHATFI